MKKINNSIHQVTNSWFDWVEVNWESQNSNYYTVPAELLLWGNVIYWDGTKSLLASVCLLRSTKNMTTHYRMFFAKRDFICDEHTGLPIVEHSNILSTAFLVPALPKMYGGGRTLNYMVLNSEGPCRYVDLFTALETPLV